MSTREPVPSCPVCRKTDREQRAGKACERAEKAEAALDDASEVLARGQRAEAALARVRALCDDWDREYTAPTAQVDCYMRAAAYKIRAAIDGEAGQ